MVDRENVGAFFVSLEAAAEEISPEERAVGPQAVSSDLRAVLTQRR